MKGALKMGALIFLVVFMFGILVLHFAAAVVYKIVKRSKKSIWWIMDNVL